MPQSDRRVRAIALNVTGLAAPVEMRRHPGARRLTLRVSTTRQAVVVTVPPRCGIDEACLFVHRNIEWVRERLGNMPEPVPFQCGAEVPLRGRQHMLRFIGAGTAGPVVRPRAGPDTERALLEIKGAPEHAPRRLRDWLYAEAGTDLDQRVRVHCRRLGLAARRIIVRDQASRWGSCSSAGVLSFSWRLVLAPPQVLDYVAAHEVAHLAEMNHGPRFWALVARSMPELDSAKSWLRQHGNDLHRYGNPPGIPLRRAA